MPDPADPQIGILENYRIFSSNYGVMWVVLCCVVVAGCSEREDLVQSASMSGRDTCSMSMSYMQYEYVIHAV
jgi:hypothetical protein